MPSFSTNSIRRLDTCHPDLKIIFEQVVRLYDCSILEGHRSAARQEELYQDQKTQVRYPNSKHNSEPSMACDVAPYPVNWSTAGKTIGRYYYLAALVEALSKVLYAQNVITHHVRWGGDWDMDKDFDDQSFDDLVHFELYNPEEN